MIPPYATLLSTAPYTSLHHGRVPCGDRPISALGSLPFRIGSRIARPSEGAGSLFGQEECARACDGASCGYQCTGRRLSRGTVQKEDPRGPARSVSERGS